MRWFIQFGYDFKKMGVSIIIGEEKKDDLVGYGYDIAPCLMYLTIQILFIEIKIGNLFLK